MVLDVIRHSRRKSQMLQGYGDSVLCAETVAKKLAKEREYSSRLLMKYDGQAASTRIVSSSLRRKMTISEGATSL